ncbi:hypothetical protein [Ralstonia phage RSK1]|uniref:Uncharacterized protein n=1 Tax=Ralstonia phage RSK1 TaxID=1417599 RepID=U6C708_9CAUD|nr:hypothetical protein X532_gp38 [Ralstonia phage RSK1]BAO04703.1 hypothetical protein [Ralstonia phage RSK1]
MNHGHHQARDRQHRTRQARQQVSRASDLLRAAKRGEMQNDSVTLALDVGAIVSFGIAVGTFIYIYFTL